MKRNKVHLLEKMINTHLIWILICIIGLLVGSLYCISIKNNIDFFLELNEIITGEEAYIDTRREIFVMALVIHGIQLFGIWFSGFIKNTKPIGTFILFLISVNYGFSLSALLMLYGLKGIGLGILFFGMQGVGLLFLGIMLNEYGRQYIKRGKEVYGKIYNKLSICCGIGALLIAIVDSYFQPMIWKLFHS